MKDGMIRERLSGIILIAISVILFIWSTIYYSTKHVSCITSNTPISLFDLLPIVAILTMIFGIAEVMKWELV